MTYPEIHFGTDGWRGRVAEDYTFSSVRRCAQGFATYMKEHDGVDQPIVVGHDKRFSAEHFAATVAEVLAGNGFKVLLTDGPTPTPTISYAAVANKAAGAVNITASHNPPEDNGFKVRNKFGGAIAPNGLKEIESAIPTTDEGIQSIPLRQAIEVGSITMFDASTAYEKQIKSLIDLEPIRQAGLTILVDAMWGNGAGWFPRLLSGGTTSVIEIHNTRNPSFPDMIRPEPIHPNIDVGLNEVVELGADVLLINDGDADRVGFGDEQGNFIDQLRAYGLLAYYLLEIRELRGPIVKTLSTTSMLNKLGELYDVDVIETGVGFKFVAPKMLEVDGLIGGEESGGYAFRGHVPERDGILAGIYFLDLMVRTGQKPSQLVKTLFDAVGAHFYDRIDSPLEAGKRGSYEENIRNANPSEIAGFKVLGLIDTDGYKFVLDDGGWLLLRFSGTEPIVRVYCETTREDKVQPILETGLKIVGLRK